MQILCLTGWQQRYDALAAIMPGALHFNYAPYTDSKTMFAALPAQPDVAVGWSLGGQLLVRAVAGGFIRPKKLVLLAAPFQCVADSHFTTAMPAEAFKAIRKSYIENPQQMMKEFQAIAGFGHRKIIRELMHNLTIWDNGLFWLDELGRATCRDLDFNGFPETTIVHGTNDKVTDPAQARAFFGHIAGAHLAMLPGASHALHLHDPDMLRKQINV